MPALHIRNVPHETVETLKARAALHGRSLEAELRDLLDRAAGGSTPGAGSILDRVVTVSTGHHENFSRADIYSDDDADGR